MHKITALILVMLFAVSSCKKQENTDAQKNNGLNLKMYVESKKGIILRSAPDASSQALATIQDREEVLVIKYSDKKDKIGNINAPWANVKYRHLEGWVFSGYLSAGFKKGNYKNHDKNQIISAVSSARKTMFRTGNGDETREYNTPDQIKIKELEGDLCIVELYNEGCLEAHPETGDALWYYKDGKWNDFNLVSKLGIDACPGAINITLLFLNNDEFIDIVAIGNVSATYNVRVYLNDGNKFNLVESIDTDERSGTESIGPCGATVFRVYGSDGVYLHMFNCVTNKFDIIYEGQE